MFAAWSRSCSTNKIVSYAYYNIKMPPSTKYGTSPLICPSSLTRDINMANIFAILLKSKWDNGSPNVTMDLPILNLSLSENIVQYYHLLLPLHFIY
jgi:RNA recognition motif-containing protein